MSTRKIKDAKDLSTNELIYFKGHAQATYMSDGRTVEEAVNSMSGGSSGSSDFFYFDVLSAVYENGYELDENGNVSNAQFNASEYISEIETAVFNNKFVIVLDSLQVFNIEIEDFGGQSFYVYATCYSYNTWKHISISFQRSSGEVYLNIQDILDGSGSGSGGSIDTSKFITGIILNGVLKTPDSNGAVDVGYKFKQKIESTSSSLSLAPNIYYVITSVLSSYTFTLTTLGNTDFMQEHFVEFTTSSSGSTVSFPSTIKWANGTAPIFEAGYTYQVSIVNNLGSYIKFK